MIKSQGWISCYTCGSWIKPDKQGTYRCPKCKSKYKKNGEQIERLSLPKVLNK